MAIVGVPFGSGVSYRPGARFGPSRIRESSRLLRPYNPALQVPVFARQQVADAGDLTVNPFSIDEAIVAVVVHFDAHLDTWDTCSGAASAHGTQSRRAAGEGFLDRTGCLHAGIRGPLYTGADLDQDSELGFQVIAAPRWSR